MEIKKVNKILNVFSRRDTEVEAVKMAFCRRMKMPNTGTEPKEGTGFGDLPYAPWEKFKP